MTKKDEMPKSLKKALLTISSEDAEEIWEWLGNSDDPLQQINDVIMKL